MADNVTTVRGVYEAFAQATGVMPVEVSQAR